MQLGKEWREVEVLEWREQGKGLVAQFKRYCHDRNAAEALHGAVIWTAKQNLPDLSDGDYYWSDLLMKCVDGRWSAIRASRIV
jgi:16S rRNA processing protein RimM